RWERIAAHEPELIQPRSRVDHDAERPWGNLQVQRPPVARRNALESVAVVGDEPGEDVQAPGRALRVRFSQDVGRKIQVFQQGNEVERAALENLLRREVDLADQDVAQAIEDAGGAGREKARGDLVSNWPEPQVEARGLELRFV